jgi:hypothetical protein
MAAASIGRPFRIPRVPRVNVLPHSTRPYSSEEKDADHVTEFFRDTISFEFATNSPRRFRGHLLEKETIQNLIMAGSDGETYHPFGRIDERVSINELQQAINENMLNTPEKEHVLTAVSEYELRSARRQLFIDEHVRANDLSQGMTR